MDMRAKISEICKDYKELLLSANGLTFRERVEREHKLMRQYKSREIFELLQNIDDEYDAKCGKPCVAEFSLREDGWLEVSNYGKPFTIDTLQRLCHGTVSIKYGDVIGCKGIGFRSVLNWSDKIEIYSGKGEDYISAGFSNEYALSLMKEIEKDTHISNMVRELLNRGIPPTYPMLMAPYPIEPIDKTYDTVIRLHIKDQSLQNSIIDDIINFDKSVILFMPHITEIIFKGYGIGHKSITKTAFSDGQVTVRETLNGAASSEEQYTLRTKTCRIDHEYKGANKINMAIGIPKFAQPGRTYQLYSYFPLKCQTSPFKALLHATFCLTDNRNELDISADDERRVNKEVAERLLDFYVATVCETQKGDDRLRILIPIGFTDKELNFQGNLGALNCDEEYVETCRKAPIFHTITDSYVTSDIRPVLLSNIPDHFKNSNKFGRIVDYNNDNVFFRFSRMVCGYYSSNMDREVEDYLFCAINEESSHWSISQRIATFKWWNDKGFFAKLPRLLYNLNGDFIVSQTEPCFLSGGISNLPDWAKITILLKDEETELIKAYRQEIDINRKVEETDTRVLPRLINSKLINLQEQSSRRALISPVNNSVGDNYDNALSFVRWLVPILLSSEKSNDSIVREVQFNLPTASGKVAHARKMFFGKDYGNDIGEEIFRQINGYEAMASINILGLTEEYSQEEIMRALGQLGVTKYPHAEQAYSKVEAECTEQSYINRLLSEHPISSPVTFYNTSLLTIPNLEQILKLLDTVTILKWLDKDSRLVDNRYEPDESYIYYKPRITGQKNTLRYEHDSHLPSFIRHIFATTPWVNFKGKKYAPGQILLTNDEFLLDIGYPILSDSEIARLASASGCTPSRVKSLLKAAGTKESMLELQAEDFYKILLLISDIENEKSHRFSRRLYRDIIQNGRSPEKLTGFFMPCANKTKFFKYGKVLAGQHRGNMTYRPVDEVHFANSAILDISDLYFIDIPPRSGQKDDFNKIFNIKPYAQEYRVVSFSLANSNSVFQKEFREFLPYVMAFRPKDVEDVNSLIIDLVDKVEVESDNSKHCTFEPYTVLRKSRSHRLIFIDGVSEFDKLDKKKIASRLEDIFNEFLNFPSRTFLSRISQFFLTDKETRDYFINAEFGSDDELRIVREKMNANNDLCDKIIEWLDSEKPGHGCSRFVQSINWHDSSSPDSQRAILNIIKATGLSLEDLSKAADRALTLRHYNTNNIEKSFKQHYNIFRGIVHHYISDKPKLHKHFISYLERFTQPSLPRLNIDDPEFDSDKYVLEKMKECLVNLGIPTPATSDTEENIESIYNTNLSRLHSNAGPQIGDLVDDFLNNPNYKSLMFFDDFVAIKTEFDSFAKQQCEKESDEPEDPKESSSFISRVIVDNNVTAGILPDNSTPKGTTTSGNNISRRERNNRQQGDMAEYIVIIKLIKGEITEVVNHLGTGYTIKWRSGAAKRVKIDKEYQGFCIVSDCDDNLGYDIEVWSKDELKCIYIEVKSSSASNCLFIMSNNEYSKAQECRGSNSITMYRVVFVSNMNTGDSAENIKVSYLNYDIDDPKFHTKAKDLYVAFNRES